MRNEESEHVRLAKDVLRGRSITPEDALSLAKRLKKEDAFGYARRVLERASAEGVTDPGLRRRLAQERALCTYKDPHLPRHDALERALAVLAEIEDLAATTDQETLGLAGAIHKRRWQLDAQKQHLERSLLYYLRGYKVGPTKDLGYTGINAAFILDLLANIEEAEAHEVGVPSTTAPQRRSEARAIRDDLVATLAPLLVGPDSAKLEKDWWFLVTIAEAHFGLQNYGEARAWLQKARALKDVPDWEYKSTALQLAMLLQLQQPAGFGPIRDLETTEAGRVLYEFLGQDAAALETAFIGKVGLALSGGGFRASLFHIGVLAKLAELDLLRHVEVLSCVSGGSIIGAHYYLELRELLRRGNLEKADPETVRNAYVDLVRRVATDFLAGVQRNIRTRVAANPWANLKMIFAPTYSRTERIGELFESEIFARVRTDGDAPGTGDVRDGGGAPEFWLDELRIYPTEAPADFTPRVHNWRRRAKVPELVLNATTLNTGHNWQYTASWMGESPASIDPAVDGNRRLRRMYYPEAPERHRRVRLGHAVAASACVPGLFEPLVLDGLYPGMAVRHVDGGVHDNQGVASLLEQDCSVVLVSDASGQMNTEEDPGGGVLRPPLRSNAILMERVRTEQFRGLEARRRASLLKGLMIVHLKRDLDVEPLDWIGCEEPAEEPARPKAILTSYGVRKDIQKLLAGIRTDLDSFSEAEAYALMTSGYRMVERYSRNLDVLPKSDAASPSPDWDFLKLEGVMRQVRGHEEADRRLRRLLEAAKSRTFKVWRLSAGLKLAASLLALAAAAAFAWAWWRWPHVVLFDLTLSDLAGLLALALAGLVLGATAARLLRPRQVATRLLIGLGMGVFGWIGAQLHLRVFDPLYLRTGRVDGLRLGEMPAGGHAAAEPLAAHPADRLR